MSRAFYTASSKFWRLWMTLSHPILSTTCTTNKMSLTVRRAQTFVKLHDEQGVEDFDVLDGGRRIGRLYRARAGTWCWNISTAVVAQGISGRAATQVLAMKMLSDTYEAVKPRRSAQTLRQVQSEVRTEPADK